MALVHEMPHTMAALTAGAISEWRAVLVTKETAWLPVPGRRHVDERIAARLTHAGDRALAAQARALAQGWDPAEAVRHLRRAQNERRVGIRPAPEAMVYLSALLPMVQGVAAYAALDRAAASAVATGAGGWAGPGAGHGRRPRRAPHRPAEREGVPVEIHLVMSDTTLIGPPRSGANSQRADSAPETITAPGPIDAPQACAPAPQPPAGPEPADTPEPTAPEPADAPAWVVGHGPIPAAAARDLLDPAHDGPTGAARAWVRRLYTDPDTGHLVAMDSRRRLFDGLLRRMVILRDDTCRTPWCDAPIRHADHGAPHHGGGRTTYTNASGLCQRCNLTKEADQWRHDASAEHLDVTTPTGHTYHAPTRPLLPTRPRTGQGEPSRLSRVASSSSGMTPRGVPGTSGSESGASEGRGTRGVAGRAEAGAP